MNESFTQFQDSFSKFATILRYNVAAWRLPSWSEFSWTRVYVLFVGWSLAFQITGTATYGQSVPTPYVESPTATEGLAEERLFGAPVPPGGRANLFGLSETEMLAVNRRGRQAMLHYVAEETTIAAPLDSISRLFCRLNYKPLLRRGMYRNGLTGIGRNWPDVFANAGLSAYPRHEGTGAYFVPFPQSGRPATPIGFTEFRNRHQTRVFTFSCAACHTRNLFGHPVLGASNLLGGTGNSLLLLKQVAHLRDRQFRFATRPSDGEMAAFHALQRQAAFIHGKRAQAKGLENPVAFVGLSLAGRGADAFATKNGCSTSQAWSSPLRNIPTDTKPPVLWNLKYKNRFQHDGSMSGDPMLANLIFNEIGRGADLKRLQSWLEKNRIRVRDMTAAAYAMEAPKWTDFFSPDTIDVDLARQGEGLFDRRCARCHGTYEKAWSMADEVPRTGRQLLETVRVIMPEETVTANVGTDPYRSKAMEFLAPRANKLAIFKENGISFTSHVGSYVPPPLVGIWARWPYMHNNSIPNLEQLLTPARQRAKTFYVGPANDIENDYDRRSVGFPLGNRAPRRWRTWSRLFDTRKRGLSNMGHDEGIFATNGASEISSEEKRALIEFLKTL